MEKHITVRENGIPIIEFDRVRVTETLQVGDMDIVEAINNNNDLVCDLLDQLDAIENPEITDSERLDWLEGNISIHQDIKWSNGWHFYEGGGVHDTLREAIDAEILKD